MHARDLFACRQLIEHMRNNDMFGGRMVKESGALFNGDSIILALEFCTVCGDGTGDEHGAFDALQSLLNIEPKLMAEWKNGNMILNLNRLSIIDPLAYLVTWLALVALPRARGFHAFGIATAARSSILRECMTEARALFERAWDAFAPDSGSSAGLWATNATRGVFSAWDKGNTTPKAAVLPLMLHQKRTLRDGVVLFCSSCRFSGCSRCKNPKGAKVEPLARIPKCEKKSCTDGGADSPQEPRADDAEPARLVETTTAHSAANILDILPYDLVVLVLRTVFDVFGGDMRRYMHLFTTLSLVCNHFVVDIIREFHIERSFVTTKVERAGPDGLREEPQSWARIDAHIDKGRLNKPSAKLLVHTNGTEFQFEFATSSHLGHSRGAIDRLERPRGWTDVIEEERNFTPKWYDSGKEKDGFRLYVEDGATVKYLPRGAGEHAVTKSLDCAKRDIKLQIDLDMVPRHTTDEFEALTEGDPNAAEQFKYSGQNARLVVTNIFNDCSDEDNYVSLLFPAIELRSFMGFDRNNTTLVNSLYDRDTGRAAKGKKTKPWWEMQEMDYGVGWQEPEGPRASKQAALERISQVAKDNRETPAAFSKRVTLEAGHASCLVPYTERVPAASSSNGRYMLLGSDCDSD